MDVKSEGPVSAYANACTLKICPQVWTFEPASNLHLGHDSRQWSSSYFLSELAKYREKTEIRLAVVQNIFEPVLFSQIQLL